RREGGCRGAPRPVAVSPAGVYQVLPRRDSPRRLRARTAGVWRELRAGVRRQGAAGGRSRGMPLPPDRASAVEQELAGGGAVPDDSDGGYREVGEASGFDWAYARRDD